MFKITEAWRATYPGAHAGFLVVLAFSRPHRTPYNRLAGSEMLSEGQQAVQSTHAGRA